MTSHRKTIRRRKSTDALYVDRIRLLQNDPDRYFREYSRQNHSSRRKDTEEKSLSS